MSNIKKITFERYLYLYEVAKLKFPKISLNLDEPTKDEKSLYFESLQGCSVLKNGLLCGLFRYKEGKEQAAKIHQMHRIKLGGFYLECYEGVLSDIYKKQGFEIVSKIPFNPNFARKGWKEDKEILKKPYVVFMSLYGVDQNDVQICENYEDAENFAILTSIQKKIICSTWNKKETLKSLFFCCFLKKIFVTYY